MIILRKQAKLSLSQIRQYISKDSIYYANKTVNEIMDFIQQLEIFPELGVKVGEENRKVRKLVYGSYRIFYKIIDRKKIIILDVIHHSKLVDILKFK